MLETSQEYKDLLETEEYKWELDAYLIPKTTVENKALIASNLFLKDITDTYLTDNSIIYKKITYNDVSSMTFTSNATGDSGFSLGCVASNSFEVALYNEDGQWEGIKLIGALVVPRLILTDMEGNKVETIQLGVFTLTELEGDEEKKICCYDLLMKFDRRFRTKFKTTTQEQELGVTFPCTITELIRKLCKQAGIIYKEENPTYSVTVKSVTKIKKLTLRQILSYALEIMGARADIDQEGRLEVKEFSNTINTVKTVDYYDLEEFTTENETIKLDEVQISGDQHYTITTGVEDEPEYPIKIENNPLLYGKTEDSIEDIAAELFNKIINLSYSPCEASFFEADPSVQAGDFLTVVDKNREEKTVFISEIIIKDNLLMQIRSCGESEESNSQDYQSTSSPSNLAGTDIQAGVALELTEDSTLNVLYSNGLYVDNNNQLCAVSTTIDINENNYLFGDMLTRQYPQGLECINGLFWTKKLEKCLLKFPYYVVLKGKTSPSFNIALGGNVVINTWNNDFYFNNDAYFSFYPGIENVILDSGSFNSGQWYLENSYLDSYDYIYTNIENRHGLGPIALSKVEKTDILSGVEWENGGLSIEGGTGLPLDTEELLSKRRRTKDFISIIPNHFYLLDNLTLQYFNAPHTEYEVNILYYLNGQYLTQHTFNKYCGSAGTTCIPQTFYSHPNANQIKLVLRKQDDTLEIPEDVLGNDLFSIYDCLLGGGE